VVAGTFQGLHALEWQLGADLFPPEPTTRGRCMPQTPFRQVVNTVLDVLLTGGRWGDLPGARDGPPRARRSGGYSAGRAMGRSPPCRRAGAGWPKSLGCVTGTTARWMASVPPGKGGGEGVA
jgi:hypothetical protein